MRFATWNVEGLQTKETLATNFANSNHFQAFVLTETWLKPNSCPQLSDNAWQRLDCASEYNHPNARRPKRGISLLTRRELATSSVATDRYHRWCIWRVESYFIAGVYIEPSASPEIFQATLRTLGSALNNAIQSRPGPVCVLGDFNSRLGPFTGDIITSNRSSMLIDFSIKFELSILNEAMKRSPERWTYVSPSGSSIVDFILVKGFLRANISVWQPPAPTPYQVVVTEACLAQLPAFDEADRWSWSRKSFSRKTTSSLCSDLLQPWLNGLTMLWSDAQVDLDECFQDCEQDILAKIEELYDFTCLSLRTALINVACWEPEKSRRPRRTGAHIDWKSIGESSNSFFLSKVKRGLDAHAESSSAANAVSKPSEQQFADFYSELFRAKPDSPSMTKIRIPRRTSDVPDDELIIFNAKSIESRISYAPWLRAMGPDNLPIDLFKCCPEASSVMLSIMFKVMWTHQVVPPQWCGAHMNPIPKKSNDLSTPDNWRGIALHSHLRKLYERIVRKFLRKNDWLKTHQLQTGFQRGSGPLDACYVVDELISRYQKLRRPLFVALLDIRKAFDRAPRALIWQTLLDRACPPHIVGTMQALFDNCSVTVCVDGVKSAPAYLELGVPQGSVLSPDCFNLLLDPLPELLIAAAGEGCPSIRSPMTARLSSPAAERPAQPAVPDSSPPVQESSLPVQERPSAIMIPAIMYADDISLYHHDPIRMQSMLDLCSSFVKSRHLQFSISKCVFSPPVKNPDIQFFIDGVPLEKPLETELLGVTLVQGEFSPTRQLTNRIAKSSSALIKIRQLGGLSTPHLSLARKRLLITAWVRAKAEYGVSITRHPTKNLKSFDLVMKSCAAKCLGVSRGTVPMLRLMGIVPAAARAAKLRLSCLRKLQSPSETPSLAQMVFEFRRRDPSSKAQALYSGCPFWTQTKANETAALAKLRRQSNNEMTAMVINHLRTTAQNQAFKDLTWAEANKTSKLCQVQTQNYRDPHPIAFETSKHAALAARWLTNLLPGIPKPCGNCNGAYATSRYHVSRCANAESYFGRYLSSEHLAQVDDRADNDIDAAIMMLAPLDGARQEIEIEDGPLRKVAVKIDDGTRRILKAIGKALQAVQSQCCSSTLITLSASPPQEQVPLDLPP